MLEQLPIQPNSSDEDGTIAAPISQAILKVHSRCNLDCDYCYVYNLGNDSWRKQPRSMSDATIARVGKRIGEYVATTGLARFDVVFHGGEPLLNTPDFYDRIIPALRDAVGSGTVLSFGMQTNGVRLTDEYLDVFRRHAVMLGVSLDGGRKANDRHRLTKNGESSYDATCMAIDRFYTSTKYSRLFAGILTVVDIENDPIKLYELLREYKSVDLLLPHGNWSVPPPGLETREKRLNAPYGKWLQTIFDQWFPADVHRVRIRTFDSLMYTANGGNRIVESLGGKIGEGLVVIETDGTYELVDTLKSTPGNVAKTGLDVYRHSFDQAHAYMRKQAQQLGASAVAAACTQCSVFEQCGGGYSAHRYYEETAFANKSVYCEDLFWLASHIARRVT